MAFLAERMAAMFLETAMPDLTADGITDALILDGKVVAPAADAAVSSAQRCRRRRCCKEQQESCQSAKPPRQGAKRSSDRLQARRNFWRC